MSGHLPIPDNPPHNENPRPPIEPPRQSSDPTEVTDENPQPSPNLFEDPFFRDLLSKEFKQQISQLNPLSKMPKKSKAGRKAIHHEEKKIAQLHQTVSRLERGVGSPDMVEARAGMDKNAQCWVRSVFHPFDDRGCFYPEACTEGSTTTTLSCNNCAFAVHACSGSTDYVGGMVYRPNLVNYQTQITAAVTRTNVTWATGDHPLAASITSNVQAYRVTSFGVRVRNIGAFLNRGGVLMVGYLPCASSATAVPVDLYTELGVSDGIRIYDSAHLPENLEQIWLPCTLQATVDDLPSGLGYRSPTDEVFENRLVMFYYNSNPATAPSDSFFVETVMNIQFFPHIEDEYLFVPKVVPGSPEGVASAFTAIVDKLTKAGKESVLITGIKPPPFISAGDSLSTALESYSRNWLPGMWKAAKQVFKKGGSFGGFLGGLLSARRAKLRADLERSQKTAEDARSNPGDSYVVPRPRQLLR